MPINRHVDAARDVNSLGSSSGGSADDNSDDSNIDKEYVFKVVVLGGFNVGKTSFIKRLIKTELQPQLNGAIKTDGKNENKNDEDDEQDMKSKPTIGTDFYSMTVPSVVTNTHVRLQIWDTAGLTQYMSVDASTFRHTSCVICMFDVTDKESLECLTEQHLSRAAEYIPDLEQSSIFVVGNKIDLLGKDAEKSRRRNQKRSAHPESAFVDEEDEDDLSTADLTSSMKPKEQSLFEIYETTVTQQDVFDNVFDIFPDVHYAEVSALQRTGMEEFLRRLCLALLRNDEVPLNESESERQANLDVSVNALELSALPPRIATPLTEPAPPHTPASVASPTSILVKGAASPVTYSPVRDSPPSRPTILLPTDFKSSLAPVKVHQSPKGIPSAGSWRADINFDLGPAPIAVDYSPMEGGSPKEVLETQVRTPNKPKVKPGVNESKEDRRAREQQEMNELLNKRKPKAMGGANADGNNYNNGDLDAMQDRRFHSILDDVSQQRAEERGEVNAQRGPGIGGINDEDDDAGVGMQTHIQSLYRDIEEGAEHQQKREEQMERLHGKTANGTQQDSSVADMYKKKKKKTKDDKTAESCNCKCSTM